MTAICERIACSTTSAPGSSKRRASTADASRTTLLTLRFSPTLLDQLVRHAARVRVRLEDPAQAGNRLPDREGANASAVVDGEDEPVAFVPAEPVQEGVG